MRLVTQPVKMRSASNEDRAARHSHRRERLPIKFVLREYLEFFPARNHHRLSLFAEKVNSSISKNRRSRMIASHPSFPMLFSCSRIKTSSDSVVGDHIQLIANKQRRR